MCAKHGVLWLGPLERFVGKSHIILWANP